ncbi:MAG: NYN domain-containing protein [Stellaceae bacterium]
MPTKVACYVDGFNLYHSIDDLRKPYLKWLNIMSLAQSLCRPGEELVKVAYFSAYATWLPPQYARHRLYVTELMAAGVECHMAQFNVRTVSCRSCRATWKSREEKETDVHFALTFLEDALDNTFHRALIVSADSDYIPAVRKVRNRFPAKEIFIAAPPGRYGHARGLVSVANSAMRSRRGASPNIFSDPGIGRRYTTRRDAPL